MPYLICPFCATRAYSAAAYATVVSPGPRRWNLDAVRAQLRHEEGQHGRL
jgi:hypothetical protein